MELVERYLQAVKFWLPRGQKDDIIAELSEDIHAQIEEQETTLGRRLKESELEAILRQRGRPVLLANRYLPQQHLIGPVLFPIYRFVLKVVFLCYLVPWILVAISLLIFAPGGVTVAAASRSLWSTALVALGVVTIVFAVLERVQQANAHFLEDWEPRKLPAVRQFHLIKRSSSSFELAANLLCAVWWATNMWPPILLNHPAARITLSPLWPYFFWGYLGIGTANTALAAANLLRPYWTGLRATARLLLDCVGGALFCWLLNAKILAEIVAQGVPPERTSQFTAAVNQWMGRMLPCGIVIVIVIALIDVIRLARLQTIKAGSKISPRLTEVRP